MMQSPYHISMQPDQNNSFGQPINPNSSDPQYTPQPMTGQTPAGDGSAKKKLWVIIGGVVAALLLVFGLVWWLGQGAKDTYNKDAAAYKQDIKAARDAMNEALDSQNISGSDAKARPLFEEHGKKIEELVAKAPKAPKVLGFIPAPVSGATKNEVAALSKAASNYASALRADYAIYNYYTTVTSNFKVIKDLGVINVLKPDKIKQFAELWPKYEQNFKDIQPPASLKTLYDDLIAQNAVISQKTKEVSDNLASNPQDTTDQLLGGIRKLTDTMNKTFTDGILEASKSAFTSVNNTYDELDKLL